MAISWMSAELYSQKPWVRKWKLCQVWVTLFMSLCSVETVSIVVVHSPELDSESLLQKTPHTVAAGRRGEVELRWRLPPCWIACMALKGVMQAAEGWGAPSATIDNCELDRHNVDMAGKMCCSVRRELVCYGSACSALHLDLKLTPQIPEIWSKAHGLGHPRSWEEPTTIILHNRHVIKCLLNTGL